MFTREQILEIHKALQVLSRRDSQFGTALLPLTGNEEVSFIQNGENVKLNINDLFDNLILFRASDFVNITSVFKSKFDLTDAVNRVPKGSRKVGTVITFQEESTNNWVIYQFRGNHVDDWFDLGTWEDLVGGNTKFKGYFPTEELLYAVVTFPRIGEYAYVGNSLDTAKVYRCYEHGEWIETEEKVINITGELGDSETALIHQKRITEELKRIDSNITGIKDSIVEIFEDEFERLYDANELDDNKYYIVFEGDTPIGP